MVIFLFKKFCTFFAVFSCTICYISSFSTQNENSKLFRPIKEYIAITSTYGYRYALDSYHFHNGTDFAASQDTPIYSTQSGIVTYIGFNNSYGNMIIILHSNGYKSLYGHLSEESVVRLGEYIYPNQIIGYIGPKILSNGKLNGMTTGPHLHFSIFNSEGKVIDSSSYEYI
jgi:murein DD-endopeptidase MepM/ murein hydrolase activator NlpD